MFPWNPGQWTEEYLRSLLGQPESGRLEFKSGKDLAKKENKQKFLREQLSPAVSAFANSEGGIIVIGMDEDKDTKPRLATELEGITIGQGNAIESPEQFQQLVDSCISPFLPGLATRRVALSGNVQGRVALVVYVPQGNTAYQANNHLYYSRSEFETKSMPDHEVRLRMQRGRTPQARVEIANVECVTADQDFQRRSKAKQEIAERLDAGEVIIPGRASIPKREVLDAPRRDFDEYEIELAVVNTGELTIRDFILCIRIRNDSQQIVFVGEQSPKIAVESRFRFLRASEMAGPHAKPEKKLFPTECLPFPAQKLSLRIGEASVFLADSLLIEWTIYLDDTAPTRGAIDLGSALQDVKVGGGF